MGCGGKDDLVPHRHSERQNKSLLLVTASCLLFSFRHMTSRPASSLLVRDVISLLIVKMNILTFFLIPPPPIFFTMCHFRIAGSNFLTSSPSLGDAGFLTLLPWLT